MVGVIPRPGIRVKADCCVGVVDTLNIVPCNRLCFTPVCPPFS